MLPAEAGAREKAPEEVFVPSRRHFLAGLGAVAAAVPLRLVARPIAKPQPVRPAPAAAASLESLQGKIKITDLEIIPVSAGAHTPYVFVRVRTNEGVTGLGEATLEYKPESVMGALKDLRDFLVGKDPTMIEHLWQAIYRLSFYRGGPVLNSALGGIDIALWDIKGKLLGEPIWKLLGGPVREKIRVYTHFGGKTPAETAARAKERVAAGFRALKTGPHGAYEMVEGPRKIEEIVEHLKAAREAVGDDIDLMFDAHGDLYPSVSAAVAKEIESLHLLWIEEPALPENADAMKKIADETTVPIATGERLFTLWGFREVLEKGIADVIQPDMVHAGGVSQLKKIAAMAEAYYVAVAPHNPLSPVSTTACLHLDAAIPNFLIQEMVYGNPDRASLVSEPIEKVTEGYVELPKGPGLGVELNEEAVKRLGYKRSGFPEVHRQDGSVGEN
jgi:galactonate dehydratase